MRRTLTAVLSLLALLALAALSGPSAPTAAQPRAGAPKPPGPPPATKPVAAPVPAHPDSCATSWQSVPSPNVGTSANRLVSLAIAGAHDIWAGGGAGNNTLTLHWDGLHWTPVTSPNISTAPDQILGMAAVAPADVWAVGDAYDIGNTLQSLAMHWDGHGWSLSAPLNIGSGDNSLHAVTALAANSIWAAGYATTAGVQSAVTQYWDGGQWQQIVTVSPSATSNTLNAVAHTPAGNIWAAGAYVTGGARRTLVEYYTGGTMHVATTPNVGTGDNELLALAAIEPNDIWAVGDYVDSSSVQHTLTLHYDGTNWAIVPSVDGGSADNVLSGVTGTPGGPVWAVGSYFDMGTGHTTTLIEEWNGMAWSVVPGANPGGSLNRLAAIAAVTANDLWAVGAQAAGGVNQTLIARYTADRQYTDVPATSPFYANVQCLTCQAIVGGYGCGGPGEPCDYAGNPYFRPAANVTRGQMAKFVANAAGYADAIPPAQQSFRDVPPSSPFWLFVERVAAHGVVSGYTCGGAGEPCPGLYFRPSASVTRSQLAKFVANAAGYTDVIPANQQTFQDVPHSNPFWLVVERDYLHNVASGYACGGPGEPCPGLYFRPAVAVTRGQTAKLISLSLQPACFVLRH